MKHNTQTSGGELTFREMFSRYAAIEIPLIQRDYAQGRSGEHEVRSEFLDALSGALLKAPGDASLPLNLDFVYGSVTSDGPRTFSPLDGQQRLTTLFLLHWYLAWRDGALADFASYMRDGKHSRFTYAIRTSSEEFFDALLTQWQPHHAPTADRCVSALLRNEPWFFHSWQRDPTIQSTLCMLDAIHGRFVSTSGLYARLIQQQQPYITLHLLELRHFGLSDDLYIKMNARGKPLTPFENFKAKLEQHLATLDSVTTFQLHGRPATLKAYFSDRIDTVWADLLWNYRDRESNLFDEQFMRLVQNLAITTRDADVVPNETLLSALRDAARPFSFRRFQENNCLDAALIDRLIALLDACSGEEAGMRTILGPNPYYDEQKAFLDVLQKVKSLTYVQLIQFHAYSAYLHHHPTQLMPDRFAEWMRVIVNLSENSYYNNNGDLRRGLAGVNLLLPHASRILEHLVSGPLNVGGFYGQQLREEQLKAGLMLRDKQWRDAILQAEQHGYFKGQIEFLLKFSGVLDQWKTSGSTNWPEARNRDLLDSFRDYHQRAVTVFGPTGLHLFGDARWERALLARGDYLLQTGSNWHFGGNADRDTSWKRLMRGNSDDCGKDAQRRLFVKELLDNIPAGTDDVAAVLDQLIATTPDTGDWREPFIRCPELIRYCGQKQIRYVSAEKIYLLLRQRRSADHAELHTYYLYKTLLEPMAAQGLLAPFGVTAYHYSCTDREEPGISMTWSLADSTAHLDIRAAAGGYLFQFTAGDSRRTASLGQILACDGAVMALPEGRFERQVARQDVKSVLDGILELLRTTQSI